MRFDEKISFLLITGLFLANVRDSFTEPTKFLSDNEPDGIKSDN